MRYPASEKLEIIRLVEESHLSARRTLAKLGIPRTTFYRWYDRYLQRGEAGLKDQSPKPKHVWNRIPDEVRRKVVKLALKETELSPRELAVTFTDKESYFVSEASTYRILKAHDLITVLDDYSRYIVSWKLCTNMRAEDVTDTLDLALQASGCDQVHVVHKPRLLSDNGSSYVSGDLAEWLQGKGMKHSRGAPYHPQTQGKIERWHQTLKNRILLENYFLPGDLERQIEAFVDHYNHQRYHESINNVTPADVYFGRAKAILKQRERIKRKTLEARRLHHRQQAA
jgi:transposase InsO family protein